MAAEVDLAGLPSGLLPGDGGAIRAALGREPNACEWRLFGVMWSEHCAYRHSRPLLGRFPSRGEAVVQGPGENAGLVDLGGGLGLAFKVESHNHPSAVEPYQGAATGVGGILRDILALGARPVALMDGLGLGPLDDAHAGWLAREIVAGVGGYGNAVGVPTVGGATRVDARFARSPLVNAMCAGLVDLDKVVYGRASAPGDLLVLLGATTGRDGVGGASFASEALDDDRKASRPQVQVGDPFAEKRLVEATLEAVAAGLVLGCQDMGAAGIVSSTTELCHRAGLGCELDLSAVPLRQPGMAAWEILLSESQERMLLAIAPDRLDGVRRIAGRWSLEAAVIGTVVAQPVYRVRMGDAAVADLPLDLLCEAPPAPLAPGRWPAPSPVEVPALAPDGIDAALARVLGDAAQRERVAIYETYDAMVGARTALGPPSGAALVALPGRQDAVAFSLDMNPSYGLADPYRAAALTVVEGVQNLAAVGARPLAVSDCLNLGDPTTPAGAAELDATIAGAAAACHALGVPVVSGNVSLYNETGDEGRMPPTFTTVVAGKVERLPSRPRLGFAGPGALLVRVGALAGHLGAGAYARALLGEAAGPAPAPDLEQAAAAARLVREAVTQGLVGFALDIWSGGLAAALVRGLWPARVGASLDLPEAAGGQLAACLFGEGAGRYLLEVEASDLAALREAARELGVELAPIGRVAAEPRLALAVAGRTVWETPLGPVWRTWRGGRDDG